MRVRRSQLTGNYLQVPNGTVRDDRLSYMARGVLVELLSRPDGWEATADDLWRLASKARGDKGEGRRAFRAAFAELKEFGYLVATRERLAGGRYGTVLTVHDLPGGSDVPQAGTSAPPAGTDVSPGRTDVPHAGTSASPTGVPHAGTSAPPAGTGVSPGRTDVPLSDVPPAGTSTRKRSTNTGKKTVGGDGRRPTTGSRPTGGSGSAARIDEPRDENLTAAIGCVIALLPVRLRDQLPTPVPRTVTDAITGELRRGVTAEQLVARAERRWTGHGYEWDAESASGPGILRPVGVAVALVRRGKCTHPRCDDGTDMDTGAVCRTCEREAQDRRAAAARPVQGAFLAPVPDLPAAQPAPRADRPAPLQTCDSCERAFRATAPGLCRDCRPRGVSTG